VSVAVSARAPARSRAAAEQAAAPRAVPRRRVRPRRMTAGGAVWVVVLAALLGGIVALNVAALRDSIEVNRLQAHAQQLQDENRLLRNQVTNLSSPTSIGVAAQRLGMVPADPNTTQYVRLHRPHRKVATRP
jgi:cell division protein FtsL